MTCKLNIETSYNLPANQRCRHLKMKSNREPQGNSTEKGISALKIWAPNGRQK